MSFHQHYEFLSLDRPLRADELAEVGKISSRASVSPNRFAVSYDYGDLRGNPDEILLRWFDLHLYRSSNGARLAIKLPADLLDEATIEAYEIDGIQEFVVRGNHVLLIWDLEDEDGDWIEDEEVTSEASALAGVRSALLRGELWPLYLGWLSAQPYRDDESGDEGDDESGDEPAIPPGLSAADPGCSALAAFLGVSMDLVSAAAECGPKPNAARTASDIAAWLAAQPTPDKDAALAAVLESGGGDALAALRQRFALWRRSAAVAQSQQRTYAQLAERAAVLASERSRAEADRKARARAAHLDSVAKQATKLWAVVEGLRDDRTQSGLEKAVSILVDLGDAADRQGTRAEFDGKLAAFAATLSPTRSLHKRLVAAGLVAKG
jgi:hypothetical protein